MLSKNKIKLIRSLALKKKRDTEGMFVAEGPKLVGDLLTSFRCLYIAAEEGADVNLPQSVETDRVTHAELERASMLKTPHRIIAVFRKPEEKSFPTLSETAQKELCLALDDIQDPGNLGTIVRTADWMGIRHIFCSKTTADIYSPKALQATMGSAARVKVSYVDLPEALAACKAEVWGTFLNGENIYTARLEQRGAIVIGNEGNGISKEVERTITRRLFIPPYPEGATTVESLNAGISTAIALSAFRSRTFGTTRGDND